MGVINYCDIRIALTEADLTKGWLIWSHGISQPTTATYNDHSTRITTTDSGQTLRGFKSVILFWNRLDHKQSRQVYKLVEDALNGNGIIYMTIDRSWNGSGAWNDWIDVSGVPIIPPLTPTGGTGGLVKDNVQLQVGDLTIVNDPASV